MEISELEKLNPDLFLQYITYLPFDNVISVCTSSNILHNYCLNEKYRSKWKSLIDNTFSSIYNYHEKLKEIQRITKSGYNYLVYTQLINLLDPITQAMIYYKQNDMESFDGFTKVQKFLALFLLNKKNIIKNYLPNDRFISFIDILNGINVDQQNLNRMLNEFAKQGNIQGVELMEKYGGRIRYYIDIPLREAIKHNQMETVKYLISRGVDPRRIHFMNIAGSHGHLEILKYLQSLGADIHSNNDYPFRYAAKNGHINVVKYLLKNGVDIHVNNDEALSFALGNDQLEMAKFLIENGANLDLVKNRELVIAAREGRLNTVKFLIEKGANIHYRDDMALRDAQQNNHQKVVNYLEDIIKNK